MINIDMGKAKDITHNIRREARAKEFAPLDQEININIANQTKVTEVETQRQAIRDKYAVIQVNIDDCVNPEGLKAIINLLGE